MFKSSVVFTIFAITFAIYWFVLFPLLWVYLKPVIIDKGILDDEPPFWIPSLFWCSALIIFVSLCMIMWCCLCYIRKRKTKAPDNTNGNLNSSVIHNENNKNIKDRVQLSELRFQRKSDPGAYRDIQDVFVRPNQDKPLFNTATQTSDHFDIISTTSSPRDFFHNDAMRSSRLSSCYSCSKSIPDDDIVNIFLNKLWTNDDKNEVKFEVVGKSINQAKRIQINEDITEILDEASKRASQQQEKTSETPTISIPVRPSSRCKSEIFIMINEDNTHQVVNGSDDVFK